MKQFRCKYCVCKDFRKIKYDSKSKGKIRVRFKEAKARLHNNKVVCRRCHRKQTFHMG